MLRLFDELAKLADIFGGTEADDRARRRSRPPRRVVVRSCDLAVLLRPKFLQDQTPEK